MKHLSIAVFLACFCAFNLNGQTTFTTGYIVNDKGDTIKGEVRVNPKKKLEAYEKVFFKDPSGAQKNHKPDKIKAYGYSDQNFRSLDYGGEPAFYKVVSSGHINFLMMEFESERAKDAPYEAGYYLLTPESKYPVPVKEAKFRKQISEYMADNAKIAEEYPEVKKFDPEKAKEVITNYNVWKESK
jgi:hypothetical protein